MCHRQDVPLAKRKKKLNLSKISFNFTDFEINNKKFPSN